MFLRSGVVPLDFQPFVIESWCLTIQALPPKDKIELLALADVLKVLLLLNGLVLNQFPAFLPFPAQSRRW